MKVVKVLVVVDYQKDFINGVLGTKEAQAIEDKVAEKVANWDGYIYITHDTHEANTYLQTQEGKKLPILHCIYGTDGWQLNEKLEKVLCSKSFAVIHKNTFGSDTLVRDLRELRMRRVLESSVGEGLRFEIELIGVCTDICVVSNAIMLKNMMPDDTYITVDARCCAGVTPESHQAALATMKMCQIDVIE